VRDGTGHLPELSQAIQAATQDFANQLAVRVRRHPEFWYHFYSYWDAQGHPDLAVRAPPLRRPLTL
jgi:predicted LPLAT superfamily acyltransferase